MAMKIRFRNCQYRVSAVYALILYIYKLQWAQYTLQSLSRKYFARIII